MNESEEYEANINTNNTDDSAVAASTTKSVNKKKSQRSSTDKIACLVLFAVCYVLFINFILFSRLDDQHQKSLNKIENSFESDLSILKVVETNKRNDNNNNGRESSTSSRSGDHSDKNDMGSENNGDGNTQHEKDKLIKILQDSGLNVTADIKAKLPTWDEVTSLYGSKARIIGLETCKDFQSIIPETDAYIGPSGIFNTGTNLLAELLLNYCSLPKRQADMQKAFNDNKKRLKSGMLWHVPWGKHNPISWRTHHKASVGGEGVEQTHVLPVVTIKDPFHWMGSMCRHPYAADWPHGDKLCPHLLYEKSGKPVPVKVPFRSNKVSHYESLVGLWNDWYGDYLAIHDFPRLIIRFEDLLFHLDEVMTQVCQYGGGTLINQENGMSLNQGSAKPGHHGSNGLLDAMLRYGHDDNRIDNMSTDELKYANDILRKDLIELFGYNNP